MLIYNIGLRRCTTMIEAIIGIVALAVGIAVGMVLGIAYRKRVTEAKIGLAEERAKKIVEESEKIAETKKKEALIEAKEEILRSRNELEREIKERRNEIQRNERRVIQKEENLDKKTESISCVFPKNANSKVIEDTVRDMKNIIDIRLVDVYDGPQIDDDHISLTFEVTALYNEDIEKVIRLFTGFGGNIR